MPRVLQTIFCVFSVCSFLWGMPSAEAFFTPHPLQNYEQGCKQLNSYHGNSAVFTQAQNIFIRIIEKHPDSPFGYLGMSQLKVLQAYRYEQHYNIKMITDEAMPMALKAMRAGPTLKIVHANYDRFEKIFRENDESQEGVKRLLLLYPQQPATYFALADYLSDQGEFEKAVEYYKIALHFSSDVPEKLKANERIGHIYLTELADMKLAVEYFQAALKIDQNLPSVWESLGRAYFRLHLYDLSVQNFKKALEIFDTSELRSRLLEVQGSIFAKNGELDLAITALGNAIGENSQNTSLHCQIGNLYYKQNDFKNAYYHFQQAIIAGFTDPEILFLAGRCAHLLGEEEAAKEYYSRFLQLKSDGQDAQWIRENIPELSHR